MVRAREAWRACVRDRTGETFEDSEAGQAAGRLSLDGPWHECYSAAVR